MRDTDRPKSLLYRSDSLCWECAKACGRCSWSAFKVNKPVEGWTATESHNKYGNHYEVHKCPEFVRDSVDDLYLNDIRRGDTIMFYLESEAKQFAKELKTYGINTKLVNTKNGKSTNPKGVRKIWLQVTGTSAT